jgi:SAM-dependent methyltransferase
MGFYDRHLLPRLTACVCGCRTLAHLRGLVVPRAAGVVLELGAGSLPNLAHYDAARVRQLIAMEPSEGLRELARAQLLRLPARGFEVGLLDGVGESIPLPDASVDSAVCTFTLCTVADAARTARELQRVLRPGGLLHFAEHGLAASARAQRWQRRLEPLWRPLAGGCHLTRHPPSLLREAGFTVDWQQGLLGPATPLWRAIDGLLHGYWGSARAPG